MAITALTGKAFTVKIGTTNYSEQITNGTISRASNSEVIQTLGGKTTTSVGAEDTASVSFLYDQDSGIYAALQSAAGSGSEVTLTVEDAEARWTGPMVVTNTSLDYGATGAVTASAEFIGSLTFAAIP